MKKTLFFLPIFGLLLSGCSLEDLAFWKQTNNSQTEDSDKDKQQDEDQGKSEGEDQGQSGGDEGGGQDTTVHVSSISLNKTSLTLEEMKSEKLSYTIEPSNATNKNVEWSTSNSTVASVIDGTVYANNPGRASITVASVDGNKTSTCVVTVTAKEVVVKTITATLDFTDKYYSKSDGEITSFTNVQEIDENVAVSFSQGSAQTNYPKCYAYNHVTAVRVYAGNEFTITSNENIRKVELAYQTAKDSPNLEITSQPDGFSVDTWTGSSKEITFTTDPNGSGYRGIRIITVTYEGESDPEEDINLGVMSIAQVKTYIEEHPITNKTTPYGVGVNEHRKVTIRGFALAKIDLIKTKKAYGLDVSKPGKVIMADETDYIAVATETDSQGTCLWGKIDDHVCENTSKYTVTGYISEYLGHPEIMVTSFSWDKELVLDWNACVKAKEAVALDDFYTSAKAVNYNCAGHGYGDVITINNLKCYYTESDGSDRRYYNFTDGEKNIRVNAFNLGSVSNGSIYNVTGIISLKNYSPIIVAFIIESSDATDYEFDYSDKAIETSITDLRKICGSQDDTTERFDDLVGAYGQVFKTSGYMCIVTENYKDYVGISDVYYENVLDGKDKASTQYNVALIKNDYLWNVTPGMYHENFKQFIGENQKIDVYYVVRQQRYSDNKPIWEILLIPDFINSVMVY